MIIDNHIDRWIGQLIIDENNKSREDHVSSGKLSASMLGQPLQWQILKVKGVPPKDFDEYTLRKFKRGKDIEEWFCKSLPALVTTQKTANYRGVVGFIDAIVSTNGYDFNCGMIPHEIKSVSNAKYKRIMAEGEADRSHKLQACLYALSEGVEHFAIDYIASDDYRVTTMVYRTADVATEVNKIIDRFDKQLATGLIPAFVPEEPWQKHAQYNNYLGWEDLTEEEVNKKFKEEYGKESVTKA